MPSVTRSIAPVSAEHGALSRAKRVRASPSSSRPVERRELGAIEPHRRRRAARPAIARKSARGGERSISTGSSTQGLPAPGRLPRSRSRPPRGARASKVPRLTSSASARAAKAAISSGGDRHRRHRAGRQQHVGGEILRHRVGDAMHARAARRAARSRMSAARAGQVRSAARASHSLRRHDPDQVRWVGRRLSARRHRPPAPHEIATDR